MNQQYLQAMIKLMSHPETKDLFSDPSFMQKLQLMMSNPQMASVLIQQDPKLQKAFEVLQSSAGQDDIESMRKMFEKSQFKGAPK
jgi:hypothetical protein